MTIFRKIAGLFQKKEKHKENMPPAHCPVCWGYQEYDHQVRQKFRDKQIDVKNHKDMHLKSKRFQVNHIDGKRYKKAEVKECPKCGRKLESDGHSEKPESL